MSRHVGSGAQSSEEPTFSCGRGRDVLSLLRLPQPYAAAFPTDDSDTLVPLHQILLMSWFSSTRFGAPSLAILIIARPTCSVVVTYFGMRTFHTG